VFLRRNKKPPEENNRETHESPQSNSAGFTGLGIAPGLLAAIERLRFTIPTPIQKKSIPIGLEGKDLIAVAQTGTGKTLAFGIPMIQRLAQIKGRGLVILPTRELALQVDEAILAVGRKLGVRTAVLIGGASMNLQRNALDKKPRIIIATPGRLLDHLQHRTINLSDIRILVLDEADRMLDMGFAPQINKIMETLPRERQTMLFSATIPNEIMAIARRHMEMPIHVEIARSGTTVDTVTQELFFIAKESKPRLLEALLGQGHGPVLVFTRTKHGARKLTRQVKTMGSSAAEIHSNRSLAQRRDALQGFKAGKYRVLVATDIAARGIDVTGIEMVVNYDLPSNTEDYVHRIGRTARAGRTGRAVSFATFDQRSDVRSIEAFIRSSLHVSELPTLPPHRGGHAKFEGPEPQPYVPKQRRQPSQPPSDFGRSPRRRSESDRNKRMRRG
jgi:ATP-dependent RNA helicase RhlE